MFRCLAVLMVVITLSGCQTVSQVQTAKVDDPKLDPWMSMPANTPDGGTDTPSRIHTDLWSKGRPALVAKQKAILNKEIGKGLLNPGYPLADLSNQTSEEIEGGIASIPISGIKPIRVEGLITAHPRHAHAGRLFGFLRGRTATVRINDKPHTVAINKPFVITLPRQEISSCQVEVPPQLTQEPFASKLCELRFYK